MFTPANFSTGPVIAELALLVGLTGCPGVLAEAKYVTLVLGNALTALDFTSLHPEPLAVVELVLIPRHTLRNTLDPAAQLDKGFLETVPSLFKTVDFAAGFATAGL